MTDDKPVPMLRLIEHIRKRPGMYIGGINRDALDNMLLEAVGNAINEVINQAADTIAITLLDGGKVTITDNGSGIPVSMDEKTGKPILEHILTEHNYQKQMAVKAARNFLRYGFRVYGLSIVAVNALSSLLEVHVRRDGYEWRQVYEKGVAQTSVEQVRVLRPEEVTGTTITFIPDDTILETLDYDAVTLTRRFRELAYLVKGVTITLDDRRSSPHTAKSETFHYPGGLVDYVNHLNRDYQPLHDPIVVSEIVKHKAGTMQVEIALQYINESHTIILSYVNAAPTKFDGTHVDGLIEGLHRKISFQERRILAEDIKVGLCAMVSLWHPDTYYEGSMPFKLINPEVVEVVRDVVMRAIDKADPAVVARMVERCMQTVYLRESRL